MLQNTLPIIEVDEFEATSVVSVRDLLSVAVPARAFLPKAKNDTLTMLEVERLRDLHDVIQRSFSGEKKKNAQGSLAQYIRGHWMTRVKPGGPYEGFIPPVTLYFAEKLDIVDGEAELKSKGILMDGESRGEALLVNLEGDELTPGQKKELLDRKIVAHIVHNIDDTKVVRKYFGDVNGKGIQVNPNLRIMGDYTDPYAEVTKSVFDSIGLDLETKARQVSSKSTAVMTGLQARMMIAAVAKGVGAVQFGGKAIPTEGVDFAKLEAVSTAWLREVFGRFNTEEFRSKDNVLRAAPVMASLGALGKAFYDEDVTAQAHALAVLNDPDIDWSVGRHWSGLAGKVNPSSGKFAVGGGKEYAYATFRALNDPASPSGLQVRGKALAPVAV